MKYGYARISTIGQDLRTQINTLEAEGCDVIFTEKHTGTKIDRKEFSRLISEIQEGDTLVVTKLDRFARSVRGGIEVIKNLFDLGVRVHVLNMGVIENTPTGVTAKLK